MVDVLSFFVWYNTSKEGGFMKKWKIYSIIITIILVLVIIGVCVYAFVIRETFTEEEAKNIALQRVGKTNDEVTFTKVRTDRENGITVYEVDFYDTEKEYELSIDVETKEVISYKEDELHTHNDNSNTAPTNNYIGTKRAKEIVLDHAKLSSSEVTFRKVELDVDYQIATYEIEFDYQYFEYEYELNAVTGKILKYERDR